MNLLLENLPFIMQGIEITISLAAVTLFFSIIISFILGSLAVTRFKVFRWTVGIYVEVFRDIPLIVNIFFIFFVGPTLGLELSSFSAVVIGLSLWGGANGAEIVRGGLEVIPPHQKNSAAALGLKGWEVLIFIVIPQAMKSIIPSFIGLLTLLVQATSLGALVGVTEFFKTGQIVVERTVMMDGYNPAFLVYSSVLLFYFIVCSALSWLGRRLQKRLKQERKAVVLIQEEAPAI